MFILDDSGSMTWDFMPDSVPPTSPVNIASQAFTRNGVFYNPAITYLPWSDKDGNVCVSTFTSVACSVRSEEHTSELQSLMRNSYAVFCLKKKKNKIDLLQMQQTRHKQ